MNPVKYGYKFDEGENLVPTVMMELSTPVGFLFLVIILNIHDQESTNVGRDRLSVAVIKNILAMQKAKSHELTASVTLTFI